MNYQSDEDFREAFKPVHVPAHYEDAVSLQDKAIFALANINEGTADDILAEMKQLDPAVPSDENTTMVKELLTHLYKNGLLGGADHAGVTHYNLHKITRANDGATDPDLLAPGLD